ADRGRHGAGGAGTGREHAGDGDGLSPGRRPAGADTLLHDGEPAAHAGGSVRRGHGRSEVRFCGRHQPGVAGGGAHAQRDAADGGREPPDVGLGVFRKRAGQDDGSRAIRPGTIGENIMALYMLLLYDDPTVFTTLSAEDMQKATEKYMAWSQMPFTRDSKRL